MSTRRELLAGVAGLCAAGPLATSAARAAAGASSGFNAIPSTGESIPAVGLGSWITFDVADFGDRRDGPRDVIRAFFDRGGAMIDSSPMYGFAQEVIGQSLARIDNDDALFSATKVWMPGGPTGRLQMNNALDLWGLERFDLLQVHNMVDWDTHLPWLQEWKSEGRLRYTGITTSHGRRHGPLASVIREQPFDFVQFTYNIRYREAEARLLPLALEHGKAVIINRPFDGGRLFPTVEGRPLPDWAAEIGCRNWAQFFLKFIISHPAVTCAIPATSQVPHLHENMGALEGPMPDQRQRAEMLAYWESVARL